MSHGDDDRFRIRPGAPKQRGDAFINKVLRKASKAGAKAIKAGKRPGARLGRGHVAARFTGSALTAHSRRVTIKTRLVNLAKAGARSTATHPRYIEREGVGRHGKPGKAYGPMNDDVDLSAFEERGREDRRQFCFIVSPEDAEHGTGSGDGAVTHTPIRRRAGRLFRSSSPQYAHVSFQQRPSEAI